MFLSNVAARFAMLIRIMDELLVPRWSIRGKMLSVRLSLTQVGDCTAVLKDRADPGGSFSRK